METTKMNAADIAAKKRLDQMFADNPSFVDGTGWRHFPEKVLANGRTGAIRCNCGKCFESWGSWIEGMKLYAEHAEEIKSTRGIQA